MNIETLNQSIAEFNAYNGNACIYYNTEDKTFSCSVYLNDVIATQTFSTDEFVVVYNKIEREGYKTIGDKRKEYILKFAEMLNQGWEHFQVEYELAELYS